MNTAEIWDAFHDELSGFIRKRVTDKAIAEDILQELFVRIHTHLHTLKDRDKLASWIYRIGRNVINDFYRKQQYNAPIAHLQESWEDEENTAHGLERCLLPMIHKLPSNYKEALLKVEVEGLPQTDYAAWAGISYSGAKSRYQRGKKMLREMFVECCGVKSDAYGNIIEAHPDGPCNC